MKEGIIMSKSDKLTHDEFVEKLKNHVDEEGLTIINNIEEME